MRFDVVRYLEILVNNILMHKHLFNKTFITWQVPFTSQTFLSVAWNLSISTHFIVFNQALVETTPSLNPTAPGTTTTLGSSSPAILPWISYSSSHLHANASPTTSLQSSQAIDTFAPKAFFTSLLLKYIIYLIVY